MTVGAQAGSAAVDQTLTNLAVQLRQWAHAAKNLQAEFGTLAALQAAGYNATDAQAALNFINFMNGIASVYYGTGTQATASNYDAAFAPLWAGQ